MKYLLLLTCLLLSQVSLAQNKQNKYYAILDKGKAAYAAENFKEALSQFDKAVKADKNNLEAYSWRARTKVDLKDLKGALADFSVILKAEPDNYGALVNRGNVYALSNEHSNAVDDYTNAIQRDSFQPDAYINRGDVLFDMGYYPAAALDYDRAIMMQPTDLMLYRKLSDCYNAQGLIDKTQNVLERILKVDSTDFLARLNLAFCYLGRTEYQRALSMYEKMYLEQPENPYLLNNYGYAKFKNGRTAEGLALIQRSLEILAENAYAYKYLAEIYLYMEDRSSACYAIQKGLQLGFTASYGTELENLQTVHCK